MVTHKINDRDKRIPTSERRGIYDILYIPYVFTNIVVKPDSLQKPLICGGNVSQGVGASEKRNWEHRTYRMPAACMVDIRYIKYRFNLNYYSMN